MAQRRGDDNQASPLYKKALERDANLVDAANNLGVLAAKQGRLTLAIELWQGAFARAPGDSKVGMNLAHVFCAAGQVAASRSSVLRVLRFNPDLGPARKLLRGLGATPPECSP
jgi:Flp pilus assembly protein TadD